MNDYNWFIDITYKDSRKQRFITSSVKVLHSSLNMFGKTYETDGRKKALPTSYVFMGKSIEMKNIKNFKVTPLNN